MGRRGGGGVGLRLLQLDQLHEYNSSFYIKRSVKVFYSKILITLISHKSPYTTPFFEKGETSMTTRRSMMTTANSLIKDPQMKKERKFWQTYMNVVLPIFRARCKIITEKVHYDESWTFLFLFHFLSHRNYWVCIMFTITICACCLLCIGQKWSNFNFL